MIFVLNSFKLLNSKTIFGNNNKFLEYNFFFQNAQGIIPQAIEDIFESVDLSHVSVGVSFFEILNEKLFDLLNPSKLKVPMAMREEGGTFLLPNLTTRWVSTVEEARDALNFGSRCVIEMRLII